MHRPRTIVYIDGYNFYYGRIRKSAHKWLDLEAFCDRLLPRNEVIRIKYFTAVVTAHPNDPSQPTRQATYLRALRTLSRVDVEPGSFVVNHKWCLGSEGEEWHRVRVSSEKGTDVHLASCLIRDAFMGAFDVGVVVSNDSDLVPAVRVVRRDVGLPVGVVNPQSSGGKKLAAEASFVMGVREHVLAESHLPPMVKAGRREIRKPPSWP